MRDFLRSSTALFMTLLFSVCSVKKYKVIFLDKLRIKVQLSYPKHYSVHNSDSSLKPCSKDGPEFFK
jgi:hypothetical protein